MKLKEDFVEHLFERFIHEDIYEYSDWYKSYKAAGDFISKLRDHLRQGKNLDNAAVESTDEKHPWDGEQADVDSFLHFYWLKQHNGVCNVAQGLITSEKFQEMKGFKANIDGRELDFIQLNKEIIVAGQEEIPQTFKLTEEWFEKFYSEKNDKHHHVVIRRFFATLYPGPLAIVVSDKIINFLIRRIETEHNVDEDNWLKKIMALTDILPPQSPISEGDVYTRSIFFYYLYDFLYYSLLDKQTVFYGSPGTGKTYKAKRTAEDHFKAWQLLSGAKVPKFNQAWQVVQFHPSFTYEDFIEGIRPGKLENGNPQLQVVNGIFKEFCKKAAQWEFDYYGTKHFKDSPKKTTKDPIFATLTVKDVRDSGLLNNERWKHFENQDPESLALDYIPPFFFGIDEINRAELSRVFGELMYCLEYRGLEGKVRTQFSNLIKDTDTACFWDKEPGYFFVPHNVYIIGTMNIIDRSVESFDFALRRRFCWQRIDPSPSVLRAFLTKDSKKVNLTTSFINTIVDKMGWLNDQIKKHPLLGDDFKIGHTYFFEVVKYVEDESPTNVVKRLWRNKLQSLLEEYLRGLGNQGLIRATIEDWGRQFCSVRPRGTDQ